MLKRNCALLVVIVALAGLTVAEAQTRRRYCDDGRSFIVDDQTTVDPCDTRPPPPPPPPPPDPAAKLVEDAIKAIRGKDYEKAIDLLTNASRLKPGDSRITNLLKTAKDSLAKEKKEKRDADVEHVVKESVSELEKNLSKPAPSTGTAPGFPSRRPAKPAPPGFGQRAATDPPPGFSSSPAESERGRALNNARLVRDAVSNGQIPPFQPLLDFYTFVFKYHIAKDLIPGENACAITLSMTLGLEPKSGEASLYHLAERENYNWEQFISRHDHWKVFLRLARRMYQHGTLMGPIPEVTDAQLARRYYIKSEQLADRLTTVWGNPTKELRGSEAEAYISDRRGVVFLKHAYGPWYRRRGNHIDIWDRTRLASNPNPPPFRQAEKVLFWEIP